MLSADLHLEGMFSLLDWLVNLERKTTTRLWLNSLCSFPDEIDEFGLSS